MSELKVGIIGCGRMGRERARCADALGAKVERVFDVDGERAAGVGRQYGAIPVGCPEELFESSLSALFICLAPGVRGKLEIDCVRNRLPFLVEKPVGISADRCHDVLLMLEQRPLINAVGYMNRYRGSVEQARAILQRVEVIGLSAHWVCKRYQVPWWEDERLSGGPHNEQATHLFDLSRFLAGDIEEVHAMFHGQSQVATSLRFASGAPGSLFYSCDGNGKDIGIRVFSRQGSLFLSGWDFRLVENSIDGTLSGSTETDVFLEETNAFLSAVHSGEQKLIRSTFADALQTQETVDAARRSAELQHPVPVFSAARSMVLGT